MAQVSPETVCSVEPGIVPTTTCCSAPDMHRHSMDMPLPRCAQRGQVVHARCVSARRFQTSGVGVVRISASRVQQPADAQNEGSLSPAATSLNERRRCRSSLGKWRAAASRRSHSLQLGNISLPFCVTPFAALAFHDRLPVGNDHGLIEALGRARDANFNRLPSGRERQLNLERPVPRRFALDRLGSGAL